MLDGSSYPTFMGDAKFFLIVHISSGNKTVIFSIVQLASNTVIITKKVDQYC